MQFYIIGRIKNKIFHVYTSAMDKTSESSLQNNPECFTAEMMIFRKALKNFLKNKSYNAFVVSAEEMQTLFNYLIDSISKLKTLTPDYISYLLEDCLKLLCNCVISYNFVLGYPGGQKTLC